MSRPSHQARNSSVTSTFDARQRRVEMAIRSALGASPHALRRLVAGRGMPDRGGGPGHGSRRDRHGRAPWPRYCSVSPRSIRSPLATVSGGLALLAVLACWIPARRAASGGPLGGAPERRLSLRAGPPQITRRERFPLQRKAGSANSLVPVQIQQLVQRVEAGHVEQLSFGAVGRTVIITERGIERLARTARKHVACMRKVSDIYAACVLGSASASG